MLFLRLLILRLIDFIDEAWRTEGTQRVEERKSREKMTAEDNFVVIILLSNQKMSETKSDKNLCVSISEQSSNALYIAHLDQVIEAAEADLAEAEAAEANQVNLEYGWWDQIEPAQNPNWSIKAHIVLLVKMFLGGLAYFGFFFGLITVQQCYFPKANATDTKLADLFNCTKIEGGED